MINTFLIIFLNKKVGSILNPIRKVFLSILPTTFWTTKKKKKKKSTKKVKGIKINLDFIFNNFPVHRTGLQLVYIYISPRLAASKSLILSLSLRNNAKGPKLIFFLFLLPLSWTKLDFSL